MKQETDPTRLADPESGSSERLRALISHSREDLPTAGDLHALESRLAALIWPAAPGGIPDGGAAGSGATGGAGVATSGAVAKLAGGTLLAALVGGGLWMASSGSANESRSAVVKPSATLPVERPPEGSRPAQSPQSAGAKAAESEPRQSGSPRRREAAAEPTEAQLLYSAKRALKEDPRRALRLLEEHRKRFPSGVLTQEREVLAIEALKLKGSNDEAMKAAERFRREYPNSAHGSKVDGVLRQR